MTDNGDSDTKVDSIIWKIGLRVTVSLDIEEKLVSSIDTHRDDWATDQLHMGQIILDSP